MYKHFRKSFFLIGMMGLISLAEVVLLSSVFAMDNEHNYSERYALTRKSPQTEQFYQEQTYTYQKQKNGNAFDPNLLLQLEIERQKRETARINLERDQTNLATKMYEGITKKTLAIENKIMKTHSNYEKHVSTTIKARKEIKDSAGFIEKRRKKFKDNLNCNYSLDYDEFLESRNKDIEQMNIQLEAEFETLNLLLCKLKVTQNE